MTSINNLVSLVSDFPDFSVPGFDMDIYNSFFKTSNSIINAKASDIVYKEHWGCLSVKCAFGGNEMYQVQKRMYAVNETNFLILNEGQYYSSYIYSREPVESFTLNFTTDFVRHLFNSIKYNDDALLSDPFDAKHSVPEFIEKLYAHDIRLSPLLFTIKELAKNFNRNRYIITELYYVLLEKLFLLNDDITQEIQNVSANRVSTKQELYKRLHYAKDYIDSCYTLDISLDDLAAVTLMNPAHFLRQFKKYFHATPYQYLMQRRISIAANMLKKTSVPVTEICYAVGYNDVSSFAKLFKRYYALTPEVYRKRLS